MAAFDESVWSKQPEDFELLYHGHLYFVRHGWALARLLADLRALNYSVITADIGGGGGDELRDAVIAAVPDWPADYGSQVWAGFDDGLTDYLLTSEEPRRVLVLENFDQLYAQNLEDARILLERLLYAARRHLLFGRRLIVFLRTEDPEIAIDGIAPESVGWSRHEWLIVHRMGTRTPPWITP